MICELFDINRPVETPKILIKGAMNITLHDRHPVVNTAAMRPKALSPVD